VLRHHPEEIDLALDETGSADLEAVVAGLRARPGFAETTRDHIERLVADGPGASRFEITDDRIRARYGHSLPQLVAYAPADPPEDLFHGTSPESAEMILAGGLKAGDRQRVHLSVDTPAAREVGLRRSPSPVILRIDTASASGAGIQFYQAAPSVWLSDDIAPEHITRVP
jgi:putative RNA 2'-phosphotransferase